MFFLYLTLWFFDLPLVFFCRILVWLLLDGALGARLLGWLLLLGVKVPLLFLGSSGLFLSRCSFWLLLGLGVCDDGLL